MKRNIIIGAIVLAVIIIGALATRTRQEKESGAEGLPSSKATTTALSFAELAQAKGSFSCTLSTSTSAGLVSVKAYAAEGKLFAETKIPGKDPITASLITKDGDVYYWNTLQKGQGIRMTYDFAKYKAGDFSQFDQFGPYSCQTWNEDDSIFKIPSGIVFQKV